SFCPPCVNPDCTSPAKSAIEYWAVASVSMPASLGLGLVFDAAKTGVRERIVRLEPIAKRSPQHARSGPRRCSLHDVMLVVKEIGRIAGVKRKRLKTGKRGEDCARPLPSVAEKSGRTEGAGACWERGYRHRIP